MSQNTIRVYRGDDKTLSFTFDDGDSASPTPINITGYSVWLTVKAQKDDSDDDALIQKKVTSHTDPTNGETQIVLTDAETDIAIGDHYYDIQIKDASGLIKTVTVGRFSVLRDITTSID